MFPMRRSGAAALALILLVATQGYAQSVGLQVRPADREHFVQRPRDVVSVAFTVRNGAEHRVDVEPRLVLPAGWRAVTADAPFALGAHQSLVRVLSLVIPESARAGTYDVAYEVRERQRPATAVAYTVRIDVTTTPGLQVSVLETPQFAIAGERYEATFVARNTGNSPLAGRFVARSGLGHAMDPSEGALNLEPGASVSISIAVATATLSRRTDEYLTLTIAAPDDALTDTATAITQIVPRVGAGQAYHTLASDLSLSFVTREIGDDRTSGWQAQWSGAGTLDEEGRRHIGLRLLGPDTRGQGSLGEMDHYSLHYWDDNVRFDLGDALYGLSLLTEPGRYDRGASAGFKGHGFDVSAYRAREQSGLGAYYEFAPSTRVGLNFLDKRGGRLPALVRSVQGQTSLWNVLTELEFASSDGDGERGRAMRAAIYDGGNAFHYYALGWRADPSFRGFLRDEQYVTGGFDYARSERWGLRGYYRLQDQNLDRDLRRPAPREEQASLGAQRSLFGGTTRLSVDRIVRSYLDRHASAGGPSDIENRSTRLGLSRVFDKLSLSYTLDRGRTYDRVRATDFATSMHMVSAYWRTSAGQSYGVYALRDDNDYSHEREPVQTTFGVSANYLWRSGTQLNLELERNSGAAKRRGSGNVTFLHQLRNGDRISLLARRVDGHAPQTDVLLSYTMPLNVPILRRANVATVLGRVYDSETGGGVRDVVLSLDGLTAVTDARGDFEFPAVAAGQYELSMERGAVAVTHVPIDDLPLAVSVNDQAARRVSIALVRSVTISVSVSLPAMAAAPADGVARGVQNVLVTLSSGKRVYRRLTDEHGRVRLSGLAPGRWLVVLDRGTMPPGYTVAGTDLALEVRPGESSLAEFPLLTEARTIKMLPPLKLK